MIEPLIVVAVLAMLAAILIPNFIRARARGQLKACRSNLKNLAIALEMHLQDQGQYPKTFEQLVPDILTKVPSCPAGDPGLYRLEWEDSQYKIYCADGRHFRIEVGTLCWDSASGDYLSQEGETRAAGIVDLFFAMASFFLLFTIFVYALFEQPPMHPAADALLVRRPLLGWVNYFAWLLLNLGFCAGGGYLLQIWLHNRWLALFGVVLGAVLATQVVEKGWSLWSVLSPAEEKEETSEEATGQPRLGGGVWATVRPTARERLLSLLVTHAIPGLSCVLVVIGISFTPSLEKAGQTTFIAAALGALGSFPIYLWGERWSRMLFERRLELIPGAGLILEHTTRLGEPCTRRLGGVGQVEGLRKVRGGYQFELDQGRFVVESEEFVEALGGSPE